MLTAAQRVNYDVLSVIFILASTNWNGAALTLCSVCRLWRYIALSIPQIWSRINLGPSISPFNLRMILECSKSLPLHIHLPSSASEKQFTVLSSATDRIVCMRINDRFPFLRNRFPVLERLEIDHYEEEAKIDRRSTTPLSQASAQFPPLREFYAQIVSLLGRSQMVVLRTMSAACWPPPCWLEIIQGVSGTLVSLVLHVWPGYYPQTHHFFFPQLRHFRIIKTNHRSHLRFDFDAPHLESIEYVFEEYGLALWDGILIRLRNPRSVKQLRTMPQGLDLSPYPALRKLWIDGNMYHNHIMLQLLGTQIASCPGLETILYCYPPRRAMGDEERLYFRPESIFTAIFDLVRETGRDIAVREFLPNELDLPGAMQRSVRILLIDIR
jgi:hypothetical protein